MAAAESSLVPDSDHSGGSLIAVDPDGQEMKLSLRKYHVDVHIEDGFARTTIDQTYFNHKTWRLKGKFYFPMPPDASISRLAMYVNGRLMEGGMCERDFDELIEVSDNGVVQFEQFRELGRSNRKRRTLLKESRFPLTHW